MAATALTPEVATGRAWNAPSKTAVRTTVETITPAMAANLLATSNHNRKIKSARVCQYARDMLAGKWELNGDALQIDSTGALINAHHRLLAVCQSGVSVTMVVVRGLSPDAYKTLDRGVPRSAADAAGFPYANKTLAIARMWFAYEHNMTLSIQASDAELFDMVDAFPEIKEAGEWSGSMNGGKYKGWPITQMAFLRAYVLRTRPVEVMPFLDGVLIGNNLSRHDTRLLLRNQLVLAAGNRRYRLTRHHALAIVIKAWNAYVTASPLKLIRWSPDSPFPQIVR